MSVIATENLRYSHYIKHEYEPTLGFCKEVVVINDTAADLTIGTVLGKVTVNGKYKVAVETAVDGSEVPAAILVEDVTVANATDTKVLALVNGPAFVSDEIILDASFDDDAKVAAAYAALKALNIKVNTAI